MGSKNIIRYFIGLWIALSAAHGAQYLFQEQAIKEGSLVIASKELDALLGFNYASDLFDAGCIYKNSFYSNGTFVCPVNESSKSIQFQIHESTILRYRKIIVDYCTKRNAMIEILQKLREYVIEQETLTDTIDIVYFRDVGFLLLDYIEAIRQVSNIGENYNIEPCY
jgi:hypothetical protein